MRADRSRAAMDFLARVGWAGAERRPLADDASFRRYERIVLDGRRAVLMDAPPDKEDSLPFVAIAWHLGEAGFSAPRILAADLEAGFLLIEDLGDGLFARLVAGEGTADDPPEPRLYAAAIDLLLVLHENPPPRRIVVEHGPASGRGYNLPDYSAALLGDELALFIDWYAPAALGRPLPAAAGADFAAIWRDKLADLGHREEALVLRDYHAENLIWLEGREGVGRVGLLDFQDAVRGPRAYDLVSLLEDARRDVADELAAAMLARYVAGAAGRLAGFDEARLRRDYRLLAAQRNTKIIGIFTRLWKRDGKPKYMGLVPRVWRLLERDVMDPELACYQRWLDRNFPAELRVLDLSREGAAP